MIRSMTGFASGTGELPPHAWTWELRGVNARGLDLRVRVPDWLSGLEASLRADLAAALNRGNITLSLRLSKSDETGATRLNTATLDSVLSALSEIEACAMERGVSLAPSRAADLIGLRGMLEAAPDEDDTAPVLARLRVEAAPLIAAFVQMREHEGAALAAILQSRLDQVADLTERAEALAGARRDVTAQNLKANLARVLDNSDGADPDRVAQELALIALKADVAEELDRLRAHIGAARDLLAKGGAVGRKLDFLMQEFNREANTLCSKSQSGDLTAVGLDLKAVIEQMREQVQNVE